MNFVNNQLDASKQEDPFNDKSIPENRIADYEKTISHEKKQSSLQINTPLWFSVSETAKLGGVTTKTIRRAISAKQLTYKVIKNRYQIDWHTMLHYLFSNKKLKNKLDQKGIGQYIEKWK